MITNREWGVVPTDAQWSERKFRSGAVEYTLTFPLLGGEHRPKVFVLSPESARDSAEGLARWGTVFATGISGYVRQFWDIDEAKAWIRKEAGE